MAVENSSWGHRWRLGKRRQCSKSCVHGYLGPFYMELICAFRAAEAWSHICHFHLRMECCCLHPSLWLCGSDSWVWKGYFYWQRSLSRISVFYFFTFLGIFPYMPSAMFKILFLPNQCPHFTEDTLKVCEFNLHCNSTTWRMRLKFCFAEIHSRSYKNKLSLRTDVKVFRSFMQRLSW